MLCVQREFRAVESIWKGTRDKHERIDCTIRVVGAARSTSSCRCKIIIYMAVENVQQQKFLILFVECQWINKKKEKKMKSGLAWLSEILISDKSQKKAAKKNKIYSASAINHSHICTRIHPQMWTRMIEALFNLFIQIHLYVRNFS